MNTLYLIPLLLGIFTKIDQDVYHDYKFYLMHNLTCLFDYGPNEGRLE